MSEIRRLIPMLFADDVQRSIDFYQKLGFTVANSLTAEGEESPFWAMLDVEHSSLMISRASDPIDPTAQAILFYLYCDDVESTRADLLAKGVEAGEIRRPFYAPKGEFRLEDPDGHVCMVMQA